MSPKYRTRVILSTLAAISTFCTHTTLAAEKPTYIICADNYNSSQALYGGSNSQVGLIGNNVTVTTVGGSTGNMEGLYAQQGFDLKAGNYLTLDVSNTDADGIRTNPAGYNNWKQAIAVITVGDYLKVTSRGESGDCVNMNGYSQLIVGDNSKFYAWGSLKSPGEGSHGLRANFAAQIKVGKNSYIETIGESSYAVYLALGLGSGNTGGALITIDDGVQILTKGEKGHGVYAVNSNGTVSFLGKAQINTENKGAHGAFANSSTTSIIFKGATTVNTAEENSHALASQNGTITTEGTTLLNTAGDNSYGIWLYGANANIKTGGPTTITTTGKNAHAITLVRGAAKTYDGTVGDLLPSAKITGEGSSVLYAKGEKASFGSAIYSSKITLGGTVSMNTSMTAGEDTWGAKVEDYSTITFADSSSTGGTGLWATGVSGTVYGTLAMEDSATAAGSRVKLEGYGILDSANVTVSTSIGSLESEDTTTEVRLGDKKLIIGDNNAANNGSRVNDTHFAGKILGTSGSILEKTGAGTRLQLSGLDSTIDTINVRGGTLEFIQDGTFYVDNNYTTYTGGTTSIGKEGSILSVANTFEQKSGSNLVITIGDGPDIIAKDAILDGTVTINGFAHNHPTPVRASEATVRLYTVISTTDGINGDFINNPLLTIGLDYLHHHGYVANDNKDYILGFQLAWHRGQTEKGTGDFTIAEDTAFDIDIELTDQATGNPSHPWDGMTLTKKGSGLLVISSDNSYTGDTNIEAGTLELTGSVLGHVNNHSILNAPGSMGSLLNRKDAVARVGKVKGNVTNAGTLYLNMDTPVWKDFNNTGLLDFVNVGRTLTVDNFSGAGTIRADVDLTTGDADRIVATGDISGSQNFLFTNVGTGPVVFTERIEEIVKVLGAVNGNTSLTGTLTEGVYKYTLEQQNDKTWDLVRQDDYNNETEIIVNSAAALSFAWFAQLDNLVKRMGDIRMGKPNSNDLWIRSYGQQVNAKLGVAGVGGFREYHWGTDIGYDRTWQSGYDNIWAAGGFAGYQGGHRTLRDGFGTKSDSDSGYAGLYGTWFNRQGWYADTVLKGQYFNNRYSSTSGNGKFSNYALGASIEVGRQIMNEEGWFIEPHVQVAYLHAFSDKHTSSSGLHVNMGDADIFRFSAMARAGKTITLSDTAAVQPYIKAGLEEQVSKGGGVQVDHVAFRPDTDGTRGILGAGAIWQIDDKSQVHLDYEASFGDKYTIPWSVNLGYRYQF